MNKDIHPIARITSFLSSLEPASLGKLDDHYTRDIDFRDPINQGDGIDDLQAIFADLFKQLDNIRMDVTSSQGDEREAFLRWNMYYEFRGKKRELPGVSFFLFAKDGRVMRQEDFWDASSGVFEEFPGLATLIRGARRMARVRPDRHH
ncbi:MAG: nuclear transport factor 2 family protein [Verrucomicrobiota bacterium JB023]|nr:nuclear transport factor 2 family protein [Verrucomicrobiota bacterium JB023]